MALPLLFSDFNNVHAVLDGEFGQELYKLAEPRGYKSSANALAAQHGVMIISDEVMAGLRRGLCLVADTIGLKPYVVTMGKAIGTG